MDIEYIVCVLLLIVTNVKCQNEEKQNLSVCLYKSTNKKVCSEGVSVNDIRKNISNDKYLLLEIANNNLQILKKGFLTDFNEFQEIWLVKSNISIVHPGAFKNLSYVSMSLNDNKIMRIEYGVFTNMSEIFSISLVHNLIEYIHKDAFANMRNLREINLSHNHLKSWDSDWFNGSSLLHLDASYNLIEKLPNSSFKFGKIHGKNVHKINMRNNKLQVLLNDTFLDLPKVNYLYFSSNEIKAIGENIMKYTEATYFDISKNKIENLPDRLENVFKAQCTSIKFNPISCVTFRKMSKYQNDKGICIYQNFNKYCETGTD